jgi:hypothetical protein
VAGDFGGFPILDAILIAIGGFSHLIPTFLYEGAPPVRRRDHSEIDHPPLHLILHFLPRVDLSAESSIGSVYDGRYAILQSAAPRIALDIGEQSGL